MLRVRWLTVMLLAAAGTGCATQTGGLPSTGPRVVELTMVEPFGYDPPVVEVRQGETVHFVVRNPTPTDHEMFIGVKGEQDAHEAEHQGAPVQADVQHLGYGIHVVARGTGTLDYTFSQLGDVLIGCHLPGHYAAGHVATIHVLPQDS
jgi:uncharacterized cupredoxin-like copper-binding protein